MNDIVEKENQQENIERLDAQRHLYSKVKSYTVVMFLLCVIIPVGLSIIKAVGFKSDCLIQMAVVYSFAVVLFKPLFQCYIDSLRNLAACIQQLFDCEVFGLTWNDSLCGDIPTNETIYKVKIGHKTEKLKDWYDASVSKIDRLSGIVVCQRTNVVYDRDLRKFWNTFVNMGIFTACGVVFIIGFIQNLKLWDLFLNAIVPLSPIVSWYIDIRKQNLGNLNAIKRVDTLINKAIEKLCQGEKIEEKDIEQIQNYIFLHRKSAFPIPDLVYRAKRKTSEAAMQYGVRLLVKKLLIYNK